MNQLPREIQQKIIKHLPNKRKFRLVCQTWNQLVIKSITAIRLEPDVQAETVLNTFTNVTDLACNENTSDINNLTQLTELHCNSNTSDISNLTRLTKLHCGFNTSDINNLTQLTRITL